MKLKFSNRKKDVNSNKTLKELLKLSVSEKMQIVSKLILEVQNEDKSSSKLKDELKSSSKVFR